MRTMYAQIRIKETLEQKDCEGIDLKQLRLMVRRGRLFEMQQWINQSNASAIPVQAKKAILELAVETGFHSMVEILAKAWPDRDLLDDAFCHVVRKRRVDLAWLLIELGADIWAVDLESVAQCYDREFMQYYLDRWEESDMKRKLREIVMARVQILVRLIRDYAPRFPGHQIELAQGLKHYVEKGDLKWVSLTLWMGANPRLRVPNPHWNSDDDYENPENCSNALEDAVFKGNLDVVKRFKPQKDLDDLDALLSHFRMGFGRGTEVEYLLELGANINNLAGGGSTILSELLCQRDFTLANFNRPSIELSDIRKIDNWVQRGARYVPCDRYSLCTVREAFYALNVKDAIQLLRSLCKATTPEGIEKLISTPKIQKHLGMKRKDILVSLLSKTAF